MGIHRRGKYWYASFQINGKQYLQSTKTTNKNQAIAFERKFRNEVYNSECLGDKSVITLYAALDKFLESKKHSKNYKGLISNVRMVKSFFDENKLMHQITTGEIEEIVYKSRNAGRQPATIKHYIHVLRGTWKLAKKFDYRLSNIEWPTIQASKGRTRWLTVDEEKRLLDELHPDKILGPKTIQNPKTWSKEKYQARVDNYHFTIGLLSLGCRYGELASLKWENVNLEEGTIFLYRSKTDNASVLYMTDKFLAVMKSRSELRNSSEYVFPDSNGNARKHCTNVIKRALKRAGINDVRIHDFRHTFCSRAIQSGKISLNEVKELAGHSTIQTTMRYVHLNPQESAKKMRDVLNEVNQQMKPDLKIIK